MSSCFNEAAGIYPAETIYHWNRSSSNCPASMRPPDLPGGNGMTLLTRAARHRLLQ